MIPIYIVSRAEASRCFTHQLLDNESIPYTFVVDTLEEAKRAKQLGVKGKILPVSSKGLVETRNIIQNDLAKRHKWYIGLDDNIRAFTKVQGRRYYDKSSLPVVTDKSINWRTVYNRLCSATGFIRHLMEVIDECERLDTIHGGVSTQENPFFRAKKWGYARFVKTKCHVMKPDGKVEFKYKTAHDSYMSALIVARYGNVAVNSFLFYKARYYEAGGIGSLEHRKKWLDKECAAIVKEFPGLVIRGKGPNTALRFVRHGTGVENWRKEHGYA